MIPESLALGSPAQPPDGKQHKKQQPPAAGSTPIPEGERSHKHRRKESHTPKTYMDELPPELFKRHGASDDLVTQAVGAAALLMLWTVWLTGSFSVFWFPYLLLKGKGLVDRH
jgi:hypothetical protein